MPNSLVPRPLWKLLAVSSTELGSMAENDPLKAIRPMEGSVPLLVWEPCLIGEHTLS